MSFRSCVDKEDPFTRQVRTTYGANVVSAPRAGIHPLDTLAVRKRHVEPRGALAAMLDGDTAFPEPETSPAAGLSGVRSTSVDLKVGLSLSAKFLAAIGVPVPGAELDASLWKGASGLEFEVMDVVEHHVDIARLGESLVGRRIKETPATEVFLSGSGTELQVITRTLTAKTFGIRGTSDTGQAVELAVDAIPDLIGRASAGVSWKSEREDAVIFSGAAPVTFAFGTVPCAIDAQRRVVFGLTKNDITLGTPGPAKRTRAAPVVDDAGLLVLDAG